MIQRKSTETLIRLASQFPVIGITGPRQSGKTTLARLVFPDKKYVSMDQQDMRALATASPRDFLMAFPNGAIIDEVQKVPELFHAIKQVVDLEKSTPGTFILTGSSQFRLKEGINESLAGRIGILHLLPFSMQELKDAGLLEKSAYHMAFKGFYPPLHDAERSFIPEDWFQNYVDTYIDMDVSDHINPSNRSHFRKFVQLCALNSGQMLNMERLSRDVGVTATTIKQWLSILESSFIIHFLEPSATNMGKSLVKTPKMYFVDSGLLCHLLRMEDVEELLLDRLKGAVIETMAVSELMKQRYLQGRKPNLSFYRETKGFEVDTIADWKRTFAIEIKSDSATESKLSTSVRAYVAEKEQDAHPVVFYLGDLTATINGVDYVSWKDWGSFAGMLSTLPVQVIK